MRRDPYHYAIGSAILFSGLVFGSQWTTALTQSPAPAAPAPVPIAQLVPAIDAHFQRYQQTAHVPGLVYGIVRDGRVQHVGVMGVQDLDARRPVTPETLFRIASMSKVFTALAVVKLRDDGKLSLDALAETYVPEMRGWRYPTSDSPRIRVRDLLSHAGGFVTDDPWGDRHQPLPEAEFTRMLREGVPFTRSPGIAYEYSNFGYALLGRIITNVSGRPFKDYIEQTIMRPLGMAASGYDIYTSPTDRRALGYRWENDAFAREPDMAHGAFGAMGGVQTNATDYAKWVTFLLSAWPPRDGAEAGPVRRSSVRELSQGLNFPQRGPRPGATGAQCVQAVTYGMGLRVAQDCDAGLTLAHGGGYPGYGSYVLLLPEHDTGIFALANRTYAGPSGVVWDVAMELHKAGWFRGRALPVSPALAQAYAAVTSMYQARGIGPGRAVLSPNFLMDRSEAIWAAEFVRVDREAGACRTDAPIAATGALAGNFTWTCERGVINGSVLLAPTNPPTIQSLRLAVSPQSPVAKQAKTLVAPAALNDGWKTATLEQAGIERQRLEQMTDAIRANPDFNIHAVLIEHDGRLVYEEYFSGSDQRWGTPLGVVNFTRETLHDLRSVTKSVVSALIGIAGSSKAIPSLDAPLLDYFPELKDLQVPERQRITIRHALMMSVGLEWNEDVPYTDPKNDEIVMIKSPDPMRYVLSRPIISAPGTSWQYNGGATQVLGTIVQRATKQPLADYARQMLFSPLGITEFEWLGNLAGVPSAASGLRLRPRDLAKFASLYLHDGQWNGRQVIPREWVHESTRRRLPLPKQPARGYGYQWWHTCVSTPSGPVETPTAVGNGAQRVFVLRSRRTVVTFLAGRYNDFSASPPDRLLLDFILPALPAAPSTTCPS